MRTSGLLAVVMLAFLPVGAAAQEAETEAAAESAEEKGLPLEPARRVGFETSEGTWLSLDVSPDGATIVFDLLGDIYALPAAGGEARAIVTGMGFASQPTVSPDGSRIAFVSDRGGAENLWIANVDGSDPRQITKDEEAQFTSPAWTPDGDYVLVSRSTWGLRTYELWMYHRDGGKGVQLTKAKPKPETPNDERHNALGLQVSPDGRYIYFAQKRGGFEYNLEQPQWRIARLDLETGEEQTVIEAQGGAMRPTLSPDGRRLVYATRSDAETGLRIRDLEAGTDDWLIYPVTRDDQESRFTRDLMPAMSFTPDGRALLATLDGGIARITLADGSVTRVPFTAQVDQGIGPDLDVAQTIEDGPLAVRLMQSPAVSPTGGRVAFSALGRLHVHDADRGETLALTNAGAQAFQPAWSPDGRFLAYITWRPEGGHVWKIRADGAAPAQRLTERAAFYSEPVFTPDGAEVVALRASNAAFVSRGVDFGPVPATDLVRIAAEGGGGARVIAHAQGLRAPHFADAPDRLYVYSQAGLASMRLDGSDRRTHLVVKGKGSFTAEEAVPVDEVRMAPNGAWALALAANQLYVLAVPPAGPEGVTVELAGPPVPVARLTDVGADYFGWARGGAEIFWAVGSTLYRRPLGSIDFREAAKADDDAESDDGAKGEEAAEGPPELREDHEAVERRDIRITVPRDRPEGSILLAGARLLPMTGVEAVEEADILVTGNRIAAVGPSGTLEVPAGARVIDLGGKTITPGFVDTHAHWFEIRRGILEPNHWGFLANLAYGVTAGLDVQTSTNDMFAYQDMIDAGLMPGLRAFSTGPGVFSDNAFSSYEEAYAVLRRYRDHYRTRNIKAYLSGNRKQRQWVIEAAKALGMLPTTEGALDLSLDLTHAIDGFWGTEHSLPIVPLYRDVVEMFARTGIAYTPTLLVLYGGPWAENYFYTRHNPHEDPKLNRFTPHFVVDQKTLRRRWFHEQEHAFDDVARAAGEILRAGGRIGIGSHGQLQGLGYHWEMRALAAGGLSPMEVLRVATIGGAEIIGYEREIGSIESGKLADLNIFDADPGSDLANSTSLSMVMMNGRLYDADTLEQLAPDPAPAPDLWFHGISPPRRN